MYAKDVCLVLLLSLLSFCVLKSRKQSNKDRKKRGNNEGSVFINYSSMKSWMK